MQADNPLSSHFIENHTVEAARVLEGLPVEHSLAFMQEINKQQATRLLHYFMPTYAASCLLLMPDQLLNSCAQHALSDVCRALLCLNTDQQQAIINRLSFKLARMIQGRLSYPADTVARYFSHCCPVLPATLLAGEALKRLAQLQYVDGCHLNVVDDEHRFLGSIDMARLLQANDKAPLRKILSQQQRPLILISSRLMDIDNNKGWLNYRLLPVVDRNGVYMGELEYQTVSAFRQGQEYTQSPVRIFSSLMSLASVYWLTTSWLLDGLFKHINKGKQ